MFATLALPHAGNAPAPTTADYAASGGRRDAARRQGGDLERWWHRHRRGHRSSLRRRGRQGGRHGSSPRAARGRGRRDRWARGRGRRGRSVSRAASRGGRTRAIRQPGHRRRERWSRLRRLGRRGRRRPLVPHARREPHPPPPPGAPLPPLLGRGGGSIVLVSSVSGLVAAPDSAAYIASKHGLIGLARSVAVDYGPRGIRANTLCPGWVVTAIGDASADDLASERGVTREEAYALATEHVPLRRPATAEEIAACVLFLASDESSYVNGATLPADGGATVSDIGALAWEVSP